MIKIVLADKKQTIECQEGAILYEVLAEHGLIDAPCGGQGICGKCQVLVDDELVLSCRYQVKRNIKVVIPRQKGINAIISGGYKKDFIPDHFKCGGFGVAIDIGTTTVVATLVDLATGREISSLSCLNSQKSYGQDVITRIHYANENLNGLAVLQKAVDGDLYNLMRELYRQNNLNQEQVKKIAVAGNTTMIHLFVRADPAGIAKAPYRSAFCGAVEKNAAELGLPAAKDCMVYCLPAVSAFVGGDITAGILACDLQNIRKRVLFLDIGTNGEIVLSGSGRMKCCSCAAGPALEGMNIACGMRAAQGAIDDVEIMVDRVSYTTIGRAPAEGICGSGLLSAVAQMREAGIIDARGRLTKHPLVEETDGKRYFMIDEKRNIFLTQKDIRQVQLAKGAILSGVYALLQSAQLDPCLLDLVIVAGQFGAHLKAESLVGAGILPEIWLDRMSYVGNTSKSGALICLLSEKERLQVESIAQNVEYIELSTLPGYERFFIQYLDF